jgi:hypothetical protein
MRAVALSTLAGALLVAVYLALGGASYAPAKVADPCAPRDWTEPEGLQEVGSQIVLSALDGAACELGVSREDVVLAFESRSSLRRFADQHDVSTAELERLVKAGLERALDDAVAADALSPQVARTIRAVVSRLPIETVIGLLEQVLG